MLWNASSIYGYAIEASDGPLGTVSELLFEDTNWAVRWFVVDTGDWRAGRKILLPFSALGQPDRALRHFPVKLTKQQVKTARMSTRICPCHGRWRPLSLAITIGIHIGATAIST